jgi:hypothetical protein
MSPHSFSPLFVACRLDASRSIVSIQVADPTRPWWAVLELADQAHECMRYCLHERAGSSDALFPNAPHGRDRDAAGSVRPDRRTAAGQGMALDDFCALPEAVTALLEPAAVGALRIYTTAAFKVLNGPLREPWGERPHPFPVTVCFLADAIAKLRAVAAMQDGAHAEFDLWRGICERQLGGGFEASGGTERALMSTTSDLEVALRYTLSDATTHALLLKLRTDSFMQRGPSLEWLSAFPAENEVLFPPLTYLKPTSKPVERIARKDGRVITVVEVVPLISSSL